MEAISTGFRTCFGESCQEVLEEDRDRRRICLWCDRPMLRGRASMESRLAFDQKIQDSRLRRNLSREAHTHKRQKLYKMSRRELRGDDAVKDDPDSDVPQFVRHLDTVNYQRFMHRIKTPSGDQVYESKLGKWTYNRDFILAFRGRCERIAEPQGVRNATKTSDETLSRTNLEKMKEQHQSMNETISRDHEGATSGGNAHHDDNKRPMHRPVLERPDADAPVRSSRHRLFISTFPHLIPPPMSSSDSEPQTVGAFQLQPSSVSEDPDFTFALMLQEEEDRQIAEALDVEWNASPRDGDPRSDNQQWGSHHLVETLQADDVDEGGDHGYQQIRPGTGDDEEESMEPTSSISQANSPLRMSWALNQQSNDLRSAHREAAPVETRDERGNGDSDRELDEYLGLRARTSADEPNAKDELPIDGSPEIRHLLPTSMEDQPPAYAP